MRRSQLCATVVFGVYVAGWVAAGWAHAAGNVGGASNPYCRVGQSCAVSSVVTIGVDAGTLRVQREFADSIDAGVIRVQRLFADTTDAGQLNVSSVDAGTVRLVGLRVSGAQGAVCLDEPGCLTTLYARASDNALVVDAGNTKNVVIRGAEVQLQGNAGSGVAVSGYLQAGVDVANGLRVDGSATGLPVALTVTGSDTNASLQLLAKGTGGVILGTNGTAINASIRCSDTIDFASITANTCGTDSTITCANAALGAECSVGLASAGGAAGSQFSCWVSSAGTVSLRHCCNGSSACNPANQTYSVRVANP